MKKTLSSKRNKGMFEKGYTPWNYKGKGRLKRKYKRFNGKLILNSHFVWLKHNNLEKVPKGYVIHHKNEDSLDDNIENLILMTDKAHKQLQKKKGCGKVFLDDYGDEYKCDETGLCPACSGDEK